MRWDLERQWFSLHTLNVELARLRRVTTPKTSRPFSFQHWLWNPVNTIHQTHKELKSNFPTLTVLLHYAGTAQSKTFNCATIITKSKFIRKLASLSNTDPAVSFLLDARELMLTLLQTARTVVVIIYSILHTREITKSERKFVIQERWEEGNALKRLKGNDGVQIVLWKLSYWEDYWKYRKSCK